MESAVFPLLALPVETLIHICELLHRIDRPSFYALVRVNKKCNSIAAPILYRTIKFTIARDRTALRQLREDVSACDNSLAYRQVRQHVRRVVIQRAALSKYGPRLHGPDHDCTGTNHFAFYGIELPAPDARRWHHEMDERAAQIPPWKRAFVKFHQHSEWGLLGSGYLSLISCGYDDHRPSFYYSPSHHVADEQWKPLAALLETLPGLTDLVWNYSAQPPPVILQTLHTSLASRRHLIMPKFRLRSLNRTSGLDPHELAIVTSPALSRISAEFDCTEGWNHVWYRLHRGNRTHELLPEYQDAALDKMLRYRMAPNLTWLRVAQNIDVRFWFHDLSRDQQQPAPPWKPQPEFLLRSREKGTSDDDIFGGGTKLEYLELDGQEFAPGLRFFDPGPTPILPLRRDLELEYMQEWRARVDFSCLKTLNLIRPPSQDALASLVPSSSSSSGSPISPLSNLTALTIAEHSSSYSYPSSNYIPFIASLPRLEHLRMIGWFFNREGISIAEAFPHPGSSDACLRLKTLLFQVRRPRQRAEHGKLTPDLQEIHHLLGRLPNLREFSVPMLGPCGQLFDERMEDLRESVRLFCRDMWRLSVLTISDVDELTCGFFAPFEESRNKTEQGDGGNVDGGQQRSMDSWEEIILDTGYLVDLSWKETRRRHRHRRRARPSRRQG
ncbi:hypothetical protein QBC37DRAFT_393165 [Rhypophila decipiens]|uniref:F-box domain-containing protein n=1 Tax=Rhypophila decipiens TaxID=261697 RepID=A0AAN7B3I1_9PEZI|nr:hypothetical protein QBC37DRAFT_393165 [Rhypophila decipiens]